MGKISKSNGDMVKILTILFVLFTSVANAQAPAGSTLLRSFSNVFPEIVSTVNDRHDTTNFIETSKLTSTGYVFFDRARLNGAFLDTATGKYTSTIEDGYAWNGTSYNRSEVHYQGSAWNAGKGIDTNHIYMFEWTGYFPQDFSTIATNSNVTVIFQIHGNDIYSPPFQFVANSVKGISFFEDKQGGNGGTQNTTIGTLSSFVNTPHTLRLTVKEGKKYPGQDGFVKVELDGVQKYYRDTGQVGSNVWGYDYPKFATLYDFGRALVDPSNHTRHRKFSLVTTAFNVYQLADSTFTPPPTITVIPHDTTIYLPSTSITLNATSVPASGHTASYLWTGSDGTITDETTLTPTVSGLTEGIHVYTITSTQDDDQTASDHINVRLSPPISQLWIRRSKHRYINQ